MKKLLKPLSYVFAVLIGAAAAAAILLSTQSSSKLTQLEALITERFIGEADTAAMEDAAADAMVSALGDRWSYYLSADEYETHLEQTNNAYVGIGVTIESTDEGLAVRAVDEDTPAYEAGIRLDDVIVAVDGTDVRAMTTSEVRDLVRGEEDTTVEITVLRDGAETTYTVERRTVETAVATAELLSDGVGLITIENFDARCASETLAAIDELTEQGATALVFDVRNNPGGYVSELVELLDALLPEGEIFRMEDYAGKETVYTSDAECVTLPMAVLVNADSYSAAEFFAAALQEYGAATIVGEQTVGKGYFQNTFQLSDGSALGLSVGKYYTPQGRNLAGIGVTPDIEVTLSDEDATYLLYDRLDPADDEQLIAAAAAVTEQGRN